jgi:hypothetical protein
MSADESAALEAKGELPAPPRRMRAVTLAVMGVTALCAALLATALLPEAIYAFRKNEPVDAGRLLAAELSPLAGRYVRARVAIDEAAAVRYRRFGEPGERRMVLAGQGPEGEPRFVDYPVPEPGPRFIPPTLVAGRLTRVSELGVRYRGLAAELERLAPHSATTGWVLVDGADPEGAHWTIGIELLLVAFFAFNVVSIVRLVGKAPSARS